MTTKKHTSSFVTRNTLTSSVGLLKRRFSCEFAIEVLRFVCLLFKETTSMKQAMKITALFVPPSF